MKYDVLVLGPQIGVCGQSCKHCWVEKNIGKHKPLEEAKAMIDGMAKTLEEPAITDKALLYFLDDLSLYPQVTELLAYCRKRNVLPQPTVVTNGSGIATRRNWEEILAEMKKCGVNGFLMTIFGDEEYHDWFTGSKGSFQRTIEATRRANAQGFWVAWNMYITNENIDQIVKVAKTKGDSKILFMTPGHTTKWREWSHIHADIGVFSSIPEEFQKYLRGAEYKSEAEWIELILKGDLDSPERDSDEDENNIKYKALFECDGIMYLEGVRPGDEVGQMKYDCLRDAFASEEIPPGHIASEQMSLLSTARKYGDPNSTTAFTLQSLENKWYYDSIE